MVTETGSENKTVFRITISDSTSGTARCYDVSCWCLIDQISDSTSESYAEGGEE